MNDDFITGTSDPRRFLTRTIHDLNQAKDKLHSMAGLCQDAEHCLDSTIDYITQQYQLLNDGVAIPEAYYSSAEAITMSGTAYISFAETVSKDFGESLGILNQKAHDIQASGYASYKSLIFHTENVAMKLEVSAPDVEFDLKRLLDKIRRLAPDLAAKVEGAFEALDSNNSDKLSQAYHSIREAVTHLIEILAPDDEVKKASWFRPDKTSKSGITRSHRLKFAILGLKAPTEVPDPETSNLVRSTLAQYNEVIGGDHRRWHNSADEVRADLIQFAAALERFLDVREANC